MEIEERGVKLRLTIVDTPGFGDAINCEDSWRVCSAYIDEQFRQYFTDESGLNRRHMQDNRVHCCIYFVPPWAHRCVIITSKLPFSIVLSSTRSSPTSNATHACKMYWKIAYSIVFNGASDPQ